MSDETIWTDDQMWTKQWMNEHYADLGPLGQGFVDRLRRGKSMQDAAMWFVLEEIKLQRPNFLRTDFERCIDRRFEEGYRDWKKGPGRRH
jgi:hypothetical protein